jgi:hypothetical protein
MIALIVFAAAVTRALPSASDVVPERRLPGDRWSSPVIESLVQLNQGALTKRQKADAAKVSELAKSVELLAATPPGTDTDGGTADLAARVATAKQAVKSAISTMSSGLTTDYDQGKTDLTTLKNAIDVAVQDVSADQKVNLKNHANNACSAEELAETARSDLQTKTTARDNYDPTIPDNLAYFKKLGSISQCDRTSATSTCPDPTVTVASDLLVAFKDVTQEYYNKDKAMQDAEATKVSAELTAATKLTVVTTTVTTILDGLVDHCSSDGNIYNSAVDEFNGNNAHRGNMLRTLREIECMIDHIDNSAGTAVAVSDPASGAAATATSAHECKTATKTATTLQSENFADATKETFTCPTRASYVDKVKAVHSMQLTDTWIASVSNCASVPANATCSIQAPTDFTDTAGWMIGTNEAANCEWMKHLCEPMQKCECGEQGGEKKCHWPYLMKGGLQNEHNHPAANCAVCRGFKIPLVPGMQNGIYDGTVWSDYYHSDEATKVWTGDWACPAGVDDCDWPTGKH